MENTIYVGGFLDALTNFSTSIMMVPLLIVPFWLLLQKTWSQSVPTEKDVEVLSDENKPVIHYSPNYGWMNDPNGLFYDRKEKVWHLYFQYNPNDTVWGLPLYWGHATSKDLSVWEEHPAPIGPDNDNDGIFSGSAVVDRNNTSGFFDESVHPDQRVVAIYTLHTSEKQTQDIAYSLDGGYTFTKYEQNPVLDVNSTQFRDPKVFWHESTKQWIMVLAKSQEFKIQIYGSPDLKQWTLHSNFSSGLYGFQYECPGLIQVPIENSTELKWVMFLAINPGMPLGGSANQYFVGEFDGYTFTPDDTQTRLQDYGKDFYAFQTFSDVPEEMGVLGIAWASNWQYANKVPTKSWRSSMSLVRQLTLANVAINPESQVLSLVQKPVVGASVARVNLVNETFCALGDNTTISATAKDSGVFEFDFTFKVHLTTKEEKRIELEIFSNTKNGTAESIRVGYDVDGQSFYVDRGINNNFNKNPYFTDKTSAYVDPWGYDENKLPVYKVYGVVDKNILEIYLNDGASTLTNTFFMSDGYTPESLLLSASDSGIFEVQAEINELVV